jgi:hypothetical protein
VHLFDLGHITSDTKGQIIFWNGKIIPREPFVTAVFTFQPILHEGYGLSEREFLVSTLGPRAIVWMNQVKKRSG